MKDNRINRKKKKRLKKSRIFLLISLLIILGLSVYSVMVYTSFAGAFSKVHEDSNRKSDKREQELSFSRKDPISILMMGVDEQPDDPGRTDSLIVVTLNPKDESMKMVSIPRDTKVEISGKYFEDKINHAYVYGGTDMTMDTVEDFLNIPIDYYIKVNMNGFKDIVNAVGGITVENQFAFTQSGIYFEEGEISLDGLEALAYARMRKADPRGDFGRGDRQKQVIEAIIDKGASFSSLSNFDDIFDVLGENVKTNFTLNEMNGIVRNYRNARNNVEKLPLTGETLDLDGASYIAITEEDQSNLQSVLRTHLGLENSYETSETSE